MHKSGMIAQNLQQVLGKVALAAEKSGRRPGDVSLIAVSKYQPVEAVRAALEAGQVCFGESYVQELQEKLRAFEGDSGKAPLWHFIGHLQTNKVKYLAREPVALYHSVDSLKLLKEINRQAEKNNKIIPVLVQVNLTGEESKSGVLKESVRPLFMDISGLHHVTVKGLMTMPYYAEDPEEVRPFFAGLRELRDSLNSENLLKAPMTELSMGMSHDFEVAIEEGSTMIRVGTSIFGERIKKKKGGF